MPPHSADHNLQIPDTPAPKFSNTSPVEAELVLGLLSVWILIPE